MPIEHTLCYAVGGEVLRRDDAKNAKLRANRGIGFEDIDARRFVGHRSAHSQHHLEQMLK